MLGVVEVRIGSLTVQEVQLCPVSVAIQKMLEYDAKVKHICYNNYYACSILVRSCGNYCTVCSLLVLYTILIQ